MPLVSIVIPVYNVRDYIRQCIKSIINQTYRNLEIIIVNDGSTDDSIDVISDYISSDKRISIINKSNGGLGSARNEGISVAKGKYITFVDADDYIDEKHIEYLVNSNEKNKTDISIINMRYVLPNGKCRKRTPKIMFDEIVTKEQGLYDLFDSKYFRFHAVNKLYKKALFNNSKVTFPIDRMYEDVSSIYKLFYFSNLISYINVTTYNYRQERIGSLLGNSFNNNRFDIFLALDEIKEFIKSKDLALDTIYEKLVTLNIISITNYLADSYFMLDKQKRKMYIDKLKKGVKKYKISYFTKNNNLSLINKIRIFLITNMTNVYCMMYYVIKKFARYI